MLHPVHRLIFKIVFKMMDRIVLHPVNRFILKNRVQDEGKGVRRASRKRRFSLRLCGFASKKNGTRRPPYFPSAPLHDTLPRTAR
jgi:hypothetical protein